MARCRATYKIPVSSRPRDGVIELACDLTDGHMPVLKDHYDSLRKLYWHVNEEPVAVPATRTTPPKRASQYASITTQQFDVVKS